MKGPGPSVSSPQTKHSPPTSDVQNTNIWTFHFVIFGEKQFTPDKKKKSKYGVELNMQAMTTVNTPKYDDVI